MLHANERAPATVVRCADCGTTLPDRSLLSTCGACGGLLVAEHRDPAQVGVALRALFDERARAGMLQQDPVARSGVWRFRELVLPEAGDEVVSHPEGNTPLLARDAIADYAGVESLVVKHEGPNPTGSFKDRGMTVALTPARRGRARAVACASARH